MRTANIVPVYNKDVHHFKEQNVESKWVYHFRGDVYHFKTRAHLRRFAKYWGDSYAHSHIYRDDLDHLIALLEANPYFKEAIQNTPWIVKTETSIAHWFKTRQLARSYAKSAAISQQNIYKVVL